MILLLVALFIVARFWGEQGPMAILGFLIAGALILQGVQP
jgi:hypothetical protein